MKKICLIVDHSLNPRLRKRIKTIQSMGHEVVVYADKGKGKWLGSSSKNPGYETFQYELINEIDPQDFDLLYISGAKLFVDKLPVLLKLKRKLKVVVEVPDLPLRSNSNIINYLTGLVFTTIVKILGDVIVLTSDGFFKFFNKNNNTIVMENAPGPESANRFLEAFGNDQVVTDEINNGSIRIGFVGVIRYYEQLTLLLNFMAQYDDNRPIELHFYGGPTDILNSIIENDRRLTNLLDVSVFIHGSFDYERDIINIYQKVDVIYSVYDAEQLNVRLALPNKLYESILTGKKIIVASDTLLASKVIELGVGWSVDSRNQQRFNSSMHAIVSEFSIQAKNNTSAKQLLASFKLQESELISAIEVLLKSH